MRMLTSWGNKGRVTMLKGAGSRLGGNQQHERCWLFRATKPRAKIATGQQQKTRGRY
jgi:hypothetical protein